MIEKDIKIGQQWKRNDDDDKIATIIRVSDVGVTYTAPSKFNPETKEWEESTFGGNFAFFRKNFTLLD